MASPADIWAARRTHLAPLTPGLAVVGLMLVWAVHDGGYDDDTWYWGALGTLGILSVTVIAAGPRLRRPSRPLIAAIGCLTVYVAFSYASVAWAASPGLALNGSNRALLYLLVFSTLALLPWTVEAALAALLVFAIGVGAIALVLIVRLASADRVGALVIQGRLAAPVGYFNGSAALFTTQALVAVALAARRELPGLVRGLLLALAGASLELAIAVQSRGWLFTLPLVLLAGVVVVRGRLRVAAAAVIPAAVAVIPIHRLLAIYDNSQGAGLGPAAARAGREGLVLIGAAFVIGTVLSWADGLRRGHEPRRATQRILGGLIVAVALAGGAAGALAVSHGHPVAFVQRQWHGFSQEQSAFGGSHFADVGSGRYDFWRVSLHAFVTHPVGGLGQDNFREYYLPRRRTPEEPAWTHSLELRLLAHTGGVGFVLFLGFLGLALAAMARGRRRADPLGAAVTGIALLPVVDWLIHGSLDWFWEIPALSGPALGFLGLAAGLSATRSADAFAAGASAGAGAGVGARRARGPAPRALRTWGARALAAVGILAATAVLAFPCLSVRELSTGSDLGPRQPAGALAHLRAAAELDPLGATAPQLAGTIALRIGADRLAAERFALALSRDRGDWFSWLGAGLASSALHQPRTAQHDFAIARSINRRQPVVAAALARVLGRHPLTAAQAFRMLVVIE